MAEVKFYRCAHCGNIVAVVVDGKVTPVCCGEKMELLEAGVTDGAAEKHVPAVTRADGRIDVAVGEVAHPMLDEHYIAFVAVADDEGVAIKHLTPGSEPRATFADNGGDVTVYEYCNLHGLWKAEA